MLAAALQPAANGGYGMLCPVTLATEDSLALGDASCDCAVAASGAKGVFNCADAQKISSLKHSGYWCGFEESLQEHSAALWEKGR